MLSGRKCFISGVDEAAYVLVVARTADNAAGKLAPALFLVPTDAAGMTTSKLDMEIVSPENQWMLYLDDVRRAGRRADRRRRLGPAGAVQPG